MGTKFLAKLCSLSESFSKPSEAFFGYFVADDNIN